MNWSKDNSCEPPFDQIKYALDYTRLLRHLTCGEHIVARDDAVGSIYDTVEREIGGAIAQQSHVVAHHYPILCIYNAVGICIARCPSVRARITRDAPLLSFARE